MRIDYAVTWQEPDGARRSGRLELTPEAARLEGREGTIPAFRSVPYREIRGVHLARSSGERLGGRPTVVLELGDGGELRIASVAQAGIAAELAERLSLLTGGGVQERAALLVPLRPGARRQAEDLLRQGPPFDPRALGLKGHEVYVGDDEVVFVFDGAPAVFVERLALDEAVWDAAEAWKPLIRGRARYADLAFAWPE